MDLLRQEEQLKIQVADLEEALLTELAAAEGNILENTSLLRSLNETKHKATVITASLQESLQLQAALDQERDVYRPLAEAASMTFFVIKDLSKMNNMYQFSLHSFLKLFHSALRRITDTESAAVRNKLLVNASRQIAYEHVARSLFKEDRLKFAMHFVHGLCPEQFQANEWEFFTGQLVINTSDTAAGRNSHGLPAWIHSERMPDVLALLANFPTLAQQLDLPHAELWTDFRSSAQCEREFPAAVLRKLTDFQRVLVVQAIRPDRLQSAMAFFVCSTLGLRDVEPPIMTLESLHEHEAEVGEPLLIIVSSGADPSQEISRLAAQTVGSDRFHEIAMGQGQAELAVQSLRDAALEGSWLCLKNLHLVTPWLPHLEKEVKELQPKAGFRLWLTTEAHAKFPSMLLESSLKVTYESPPGIKKNLLRTYASWDQTTLARAGSTGAQALFVLAWFHAILQERRSYVPQGWTKFYEFTDADLRVSVEIILRVCREAQSNAQPPRWDHIHGLLVNAVYGGRVDNVFDMRILESYVQYFFGPRFVGTAARGQLASGVLVPTSTHGPDYINTVMGLPEEDEPAYFGLPANINRSAQRSVSAKVIHHLKVLMRLESLTDKFDRQLWSRELKPVLILWAKLNQGKNLLKLRVQPPDDKMDPVTAFVALELFNAVRLVQRINHQLEHLAQYVIVCFAVHG